MIERFLNWFPGMKKSLVVIILALLALSFIAVSCQGLFNVNASDSQVTLVDSLKGGSNEA